MYNLKIPGWMPEGELKILERIARQVPPHGQVLEVGPFCGRSSWCIAKSMPRTATLTCIDIWDPSEHPFYPPFSKPGETLSEFGEAEGPDFAVGTYENFRRYTADCSNIVPIRGRSPNDFQSWDKPLDVVFLDGVHHNPYFAADVHFWIRKVKAGGMLCGDDCARTHPDVLWTVHDVCKDLDLVFTVEKRIWSITGL